MQVLLRALAFILAALSPAVASEERLIRGSLQSVSAYSNGGCIIGAVASLRIPGASPVQSDGHDEQFGCMDSGGLTLIDADAAQIDAVLALAASDALVLGESRVDLGAGIQATANGHIQVAPGQEIKVVEEQKPGQKQKGGRRLGGGSSSTTSSSSDSSSDSTTLERLPVGGTCCNCINMVPKDECIAWGEICVRCETFSTQEGERTMDSHRQSSGAVDGNVYYPQEGTGPWPVVSFNHGLGHKDSETDATRRNLFLFMVQQGFMVVAHREEHDWPAANYKAQLDVLDWLYQSQFSHLADQSRTLMMGHSMGGRGTLTNVANPATLEKYNIKAAIAFHPWCIDRCQGGTGDCGIPQVSTLWITGNKDAIAPHDIVYTHYNAQVLSNKVFIERDGQDHHYPDNFLYDNDASMENTFKAFVGCEMFDNESACSSLYGDEDISNMLGKDGEGVHLSIERDDTAAGFFQPWLGEGFYPEKGTQWTDPSDGYSRTQGYRLTTGSMSCTSSRDCKGRNPWCIGECRNPIFCGESNNCEQCRPTPGCWDNPKDDCEWGKSFRCYQSSYFSGVVDTSMELDTAHHRNLESNDGRVIHYQSTTKTTGTVPRTEVVKAVQSAMSGGNVFEVVSSLGDKLVFRDITRNDMVLSAESGDLSKVFTVSGAFVKDTPEIKQKVSCPAEDAITCQVTELNNSVHPSDGLVDCFSEESNVIILKENVPAECMDEVYDMSLVVVPTPHFFLLGVKQDAEENKGCPPSIMLNSISGQKHMVAVFTADMAHLPMQAMGTAFLDDIIEAEANAEAIEDSLFDVFTNSCVHYAGSIWRSLGLNEDGLPNFIIEHIVNDSNIAQHAKNRGGAQALAAVEIGGHRALKKYVAEVVHAEFALYGLL